MLYIGIDPGKNGGIAVLKDGMAHTLSRLGRFDDYQISEWLYELSDEERPNLCIIEKVHSSPQMGVVSAFSFGVEYGRMKALCHYGMSLFCEVSPQRWQKSMGCMTKGDKNVTKDLAQELFPDVHVTHANADALLIAEYCRRNEQEIFGDALESEEECEEDA
jgi:Holliday junction resolvasome RuvABC endonuclease subunit